MVAEVIGVGLQTDIFSERRFQSEERFAS